MLSLFDSFLLLVSVSSCFLCIFVDLFLSALELTFANVFTAMSKLILKAVRAIFSRCHVWPCLLGRGDRPYSLLVKTWTSISMPACTSVSMTTRFHTYLYKKNILNMFIVQNTDYYGPYPPTLPEMTNPLNSSDLSDSFSTYCV